MLDLIWILINVLVGFLSTWIVVEVFRFGYNKENRNK